MRYSTILLAIFCVACGSYSANVPSIKPYKLDIQQGNVVTPKMMMQLRPGMTKSQVRYIMGTPLLVDSFHADRWDYFYQMRKDGKIIEQRRVILEFDGDALARVRGDVIPAGTDAPALPVAPDAKSEPKSITKPPKEKEKGLLDRLKFWGDDEQPASGEQSKPAEAPKTKTEEVPPKAAPVPEKPSAAPPLEEAAPAPVEQPLPPLTEDAAPKPETLPAPPAPEAAKPAPQPQEEQKGWLDKLKFWGDDDKPKTVKPAPASPEKKIEPVGSPQPAPAKVEPPKPQPAAEQPVAVPKKPQVEAKPKAPPQPAELPPEDAPDFFEKMLEKIGF